MNASLGTARFTQGRWWSRKEAKTQSFEQLIALHWDRFYRYAYRLCDNADDAEDLLSESLTEAFQAFSSFRGDGFDRWIFRILTTNRIDQARRKKRRPVESLEAFSGSEDHHQELSTPTNQDPARLTTDGVFSDALQTALTALPEVFRAPLLLCDVEELDYTEIAEILGVPIGTVRSRIHRARERMRHLLTQ
jgi:RNA polymerase sigma-70 factor, ECF subfamily